MSGAKFVRADLHVHTYGDSEEHPAPDLSAYVSSAIASGINVMAVTDHNRVDFVRPAMKAAEGSGLFLLPGIEISTHDGHLLAIFAPDDIEALESFAAPGNLQLSTLSATERRSNRSMLDLVQEIYAAGGLAIPAHVDVTNGAGSRLSGAQWNELLCSPALAGVEFAKTEALETWFTGSDPDEARKAAWKARDGIPGLRERGLARLMSSDAHSSTQVGRDRASRTLTRLRLDHANFDAIRNAISLNPKARCKAEVVLPATYPRILSATFEGGFLDGVHMDFSDNLNCLIGGRGSGKSTALLAIRAALGGAIPPDEDPDQKGRMPTRTSVRFIDGAGSERTSVRRRGEPPVDPAGSPIRLRLADLGQEESGRLARGYKDDPGLLLEFLDGFIVRHRYDECEGETLSALVDNAAEVRRTSGIQAQIQKATSEIARLDASLKAATQGRVDEIAKWATQLASQGPMLELLDERLKEMTKVVAHGDVADLAAAAEGFGVDLKAKPAVTHAGGPEGLNGKLAVFHHRRAEIIERANKELEEAAEDARRALSAWQADHAQLAKRLRARQSELEAQGLKVQAGAVAELGRRLNELRTTRSKLEQRQAEHQEARKARRKLVDELHRNRERLFLERQASLKRIAASASQYADDLTIRVSYVQCGVDTEWIAWLTEQFGFRRPRVNRLAEKITPLTFSRKLATQTGCDDLAGLKDTDGVRFFSSDQLRNARTWDALSTLETMRLPDRPRIEVQRRGETRTQQFDNLSAGQQRSVLLGLLLCAERNEPLVLDQPEDHLDGLYIATSVVRHLEAAKERRQVLIATHSANLTVLGDAELVIPMVVDDGSGKPNAPGAIDRPETRDQVCELLEGGTTAYKKRGQRYGLTFAPGRD